MAKTGVLLVNLGTPDAPERGAVRRYLSQFLSDPRVIDVPFVRKIVMPLIVVPLRAGKSAEAYKSLWQKNGSPLKFHGQSLARQVQNLLGNDFVVRLAMRYQNPSIESALRALFDEKIDRLIIFPLFPQYSSACTGSVHEELFRLLSERDRIPSIDFISAYPDWPEMIDLFFENSRSFNATSYDHVIFSFHGLPERHLKKGDEAGHCKCNAQCCAVLNDDNRYCYSAQCYATARALVRRLGLSDEKWSVSFQSRLGNDPWLQPYTSKTLENLAKNKGAKRVLVFCPAFVADCLETTVEIGLEYRAEFLQWGGEALDLVPSLNDSPAWAAAIADFLRKRAENKLF